MNKNIGLGVMIVLFLIPFVEAGVGLYWTTEGERVAEGETTCVTYGLYNPFEKDMTAHLEATGELEEFYQETEPVFIPAGTSSKQRKKVKICFDIPKVYEEQCLLPGIECQKKCENEEIMYEGEVTAISTPGRGGHTGSTTRSVVASPLKLLVRCEEKESMITKATGLSVGQLSPILGIAVIIVIVGVIALVALAYQATKPKKRGARKSRL